MRHSPGSRHIIWCHWSSGATGVDRTPAVSGAAAALPVNNRRTECLREQNGDVGTHRHDRRSTNVANMTRGVLSWILRLYPKPWRARFGAELEDLLASYHMGPSVLFDLARAACIERLFNPSGLGAKAMTKKVMARRFGLVALPTLILLANAQFAIVSYRHASVAHQHAVMASRIGDAQGYRFWSAMEREEGGDYKDSLHFGVGVLIGLM